MTSSGIVPVMVRRLQQTSTLDSAAAPGITPRYLGWWDGGKAEWDWERYTHVLQPWNLIWGLQAWKELGGLY